MSKAGPKHGGSVGGGTSASQYTVSYLSKAQLCDVSLVHSLSMIPIKDLFSFGFYIIASRKLKLKKLILVFAMVCCNRAVGLRFSLV